MPKNKFGKRRDQDKPYAVYANNQGWVWKVLKTYKHVSSEAKDPYAIWYVAATSPMMYNGEYEPGDTYVRDIIQYGRLVDAEPEWRDEYKV